MKKPQIGDRVTCRFATAAYYSSYGGNPEITFTPGQVGVVAAIAPKVHVGKPCYRGPGEDGKEDFLVVDFHAPETGRQERVSLHFANAVVV